MCVRVERQQTRNKTHWGFVSTLVPHECAVWRLQRGGHAPSLYIHIYLVHDVRRYMVPSIEYIKYCCIFIILLKQVAICMLNIGMMTIKIIYDMCCMVRPARLLAMLSIYVVMCSCTLIPQGNATITIVSYNVRGTFGDVAQQEKKAENIALALQGYNLDRSDIILFQEIDNMEVVRQLVSEQLILSAFRYVAVAPARNSAITQAIISKYPLSNIHVHTIAHDGLNPTRGILEATVEINDKKLLLYNLHLKSKRGGAVETEPQRLAVISALLQQIRMRANGAIDAEVIIGGDMNSDVVSNSVDDGMAFAFVPYGNTATEYGMRIAQLSDVAALKGVGDSTIYVSPWEDANWPGTYYYRGQWEQIDHFFLSQSLFDEQSFDYKSFRVITNEGDDDSALPGSTAQSDHLPIVLEITLQ